MSHSTRHHGFWIWDVTLACAIMLAAWPAWMRALHHSEHMVLALSHDLQHSLTQESA